MDRRVEEKNPGTSGFSIITAVRKIAAYNARAPLDNEEQLTLFLQSWWSDTYNRPLKDPLLLSYTLEELLYEFFNRKEREKAREEEIARMNDKIEEKKEQETLDWVEQMEKEELEKERLALSKAQTQDPTKDPENVKWMEEQMQKAKELYGDDFGEDISTNFDE